MLLVQWSNAGCYVDSPSRILRSSWTSQDGMTMEKCIGICSSQGQTIAATEYSKECLCGSQFFKGTSAPAADCNMACSGRTICLTFVVLLTIFRHIGNSTQQCGGDYRANVSFYHSSFTFPTLTVFLF
jgi:hypothetical protein